MPKITFFNLPDDKKETLIQAAKIEFSRVPLFEASISNIIKSAGIPRGSFYQYFEDKEDMFFFLLSEFAKEKKDDFLVILENNNGQLFETFIEFFDLLIKEEKNVSFLRNALLNMTHKIESTFERMISGHENNEKMKDFTQFGSLLDINCLNVSNEKELYHALQIITAVTFRNLIQTFAEELPYEDAIGNYKIEMNLLRNGLFR